LATIRDVARIARVSIATVSRVLNNSPRVSEETRRRVWAAATRLDYWPNGAAQSLTTRRTHVLGVLLPDLYGEFFSEIIRGIDHAARRIGCQTLISSSHAEPDAVLSAARSMRGRIDGLIVMAPEAAASEAIRRIRKRFPLVLLNPRDDVEGCSSISIANHHGAYALVEHLVELGHGTIAMIEGPPGNVDADERSRGFRDGLRDFGLDPDAAPVVPGDFTESSGYRAAAEILRRRPRPDAVFAANDSMAIGLLCALRDAGVDVPGDVAVVGFDDVAIARYLTPPLTTVHVDSYTLGEQAVRLLISPRPSPDPAACRRVVLPAPLVVRHSCGSAAPHLAAPAEAVEVREPLEAG